MRKLMSTLSLFVCMLPVIMSCQTMVATSKPVKVKLISQLWDFTQLSSLKGELSQSTAKAGLSLPDDITKGFTILFTVNLQPAVQDQLLLEIPQVLAVRLRRQDPQDRRIQNYPAYKMPDGSVPVLEANLSLQSSSNTGEYQELTIGFPLAMLDTPQGEHDIILQFTGVQWSIYVDNKLVDNDFALGYPSVSRVKSWSLNPDYVRNANCYAPAIQPERRNDIQPLFSSNIQYWTPPYHNAWVGDVATFYHNNRYHVFYLFDRRGHGSKLGKGGHYFEHISTTDFETWVEHEPATPIECQWETLGTGTPFIYNGQLCLSYGLHTTRIYPREKTTLPIQQKYLDAHGYDMSINYDTLTNMIPAGATYSISEDGISNFRKTHRLFHHCENPSIYTDSEGSLKMLANYGSKGTWTSDSINGGWKCLNKDFPPGRDCTFFFRWGKYDYIIGGFSHLWFKQKEQPDTEYKSMESRGIDFYNGLSVPAITEIADNRFLMAGWIKMQNWGGALAIYELVQLSDGQLGTKWMEEIIPAIGECTKLPENITETTSLIVPNHSFMLTFEVHPNQLKKGQCAITFLQEDSRENACEWQIQLDKERAQYTGAMDRAVERQEKTLKEGGDVSTAYNYAIESGMSTDKPFTIRIIVKQSDKWNGSVIDTEICKQRNMISFRPELRIDKLQFNVEGVTIRDVEIAPLHD